jgi:GntR family transcriptional regulator, transcriptional repressor for pyruvate dehydrogenase complex
MAGLRTTIESYIRMGAAQIADWSATATRLRHEHAQIIDAIEAHDADGARDLVRAHITGYYADAGLPAPSRRH